MRDDPGPTFGLRPAEGSDVPALTAMLDAATQRWVRRPTTAAEVRVRLDTPDTDVADDTRCAVDDDGAIIGFAHLWPTHPDVIRCFARTHPAHRGRGVGTALRDWVLARATEIAATASTTQARVVSTTSWPGDADAEALLAAAGYHAARFYLSMVIDLSDDVPKPVPTPAGIVLRTFQDTDADALYAAYMESFAEHWGFEHPEPRHWWDERRDSDASGFDPTLWLVATEGDQIAGFAIARTRTDAEGVTHGYIGDLGVRRPWRGRRLGEALLTRSLETFRERDVPYVRLDVYT
jgi:mycothiol synthase